METRDHRRPDSLRRIAFRVPPPRARPVALGMPKECVPLSGDSRLPFRADPHWPTLVGSDSASTATLSLSVRYPRRTAGPRPAGAFRLAAQHVASLTGGQL